MILTHTRKVWPNAFAEETVVSDKGVIVNFFSAPGDQRVTIVRGSKTKTFTSTKLSEVRAYFNAAVRVVSHA